MTNSKARILLEIVKYPIITDKTTKMLENNQYCFAVEPKANKIDIKEAIEYIFNVKVQKVNTCHTPIHKKNLGKFKGKRAHYKKAIIKLLPENSINLFPDS